MNVRRAAVAAIAGAMLLTAILAVALPVSGADGYAEIVSSGPLTHLFVTNQLNCQVNHQADESPEFFGGAPNGSCGTFLAFDQNVYGPGDLSASSWTPVSQSPVAGSGSQSDPFKVTTVVAAGETGIRLEQTDSYIVGRESFRTDIRITNNGPERQAILYRAGDCFLQESDTGFGRLENGSPACVVTRSGGRVEQWVPLTSGSAAFEGNYGDVWNRVLTGVPFDNTCLCDTEIDNGAGLSWSITLPANGELTISEGAFFSPEGRQQDVSAPVAAPIARSVPDPTQISLDPVVVAQSAALAAGVVALVPFPSALFNSTLEAHYEEIMAPLLRVRGVLAGLFAPFASAVSAFRRSRARRAASATTIGQTTDATPTPADLPAELPPFFATPVGVVTFLFVSALLYGLLDPSFGPDLHSALTYAGIVAGLGVTLLLFGLPFVRSLAQLGVKAIPLALPGTILIAILCVLVSRLTSFQPGYLYGLIVGFLVSRELSHREEGRSIAIATAVALIGGVAAWLLLALLRSQGPASVASGGTTVDLATETACAVIVVASIEAALFSMLPVRFLPGEKVFAWNRVVWGVLLLLGTFAFFHVLLNPSSGYLADSTRTSLFTTLVLLVGFAVVSVLFWWYFRRRDARLPRVEEPVIHEP